MNFAEIYSNKIVGFGVIGLVGGFFTGKTKKAKQRNALIGAAVGAGAGAFLNRRPQEVSVTEFTEIATDGYGAPARIDGGHMGPGIISGTNGGSSIPYVAADAGPSGSRRPKKGTYAYRRARADALSGYGALMPRRGTKAYRRVTNPMPPYTPVRPPMTPYRRVIPPSTAYRPIRPHTARYRPVPGHHRSYYHRPNAPYRVKEYCQRLGQAVAAIEAAMANNQPIYAYQGGPVLTPEQAQSKLHRFKQVYAHWCSML